MTRTREEMITGMCKTYRHDYGIILSEDDKMYSLISGMTEREREGLWFSMAQVFDNIICAYMSFDHDNEITRGEKVPIPANKEHANAMILVAEHYLKSHE